MSQKLTSPRTELAVLRGMTHKDKRIAGTLIASVDESFFDAEESVEIFQAIKRQLVETGESPSYRLMVQDPELSVEARTFFRDSTTTIQTAETAAKAVKILNRYRQSRGLYQLAATIDRAMQEGTIDHDALLEKASSTISALRAGKSSKDAFTHFGKNNNSSELVKDLLFNKETEDVIPTGIPAFDRESGGFMRGSLVTLGASSGGGKSLLGTTQMAINMANLGYKVLVVPLEMSKVEMTSRFVANISKLDVTRVLQRRLATGESELAWGKYAKWIRHVKARGGRLTVFKPTEDLDIEEVYAAVNAYDCDVVLIDYISLLKGADSEDAWQKLGAMARKGKINAEANNRVNILLCQVNEEGKIRYARSISEHCISGDTLIDTSNGLIRIDSLFPNANVMSTRPLNGLMVKSEGSYRPASHIHYNGVRVTYMIVLSNGQAIRCTGQHRFKQLTSSGAINWERLINLKVGDYVGTDVSLMNHGESSTIGLSTPEYHHNVEPCNPSHIEVDTALGYLLGCLSSDGYIGKYDVQFIASDKKILDRFVRAWSHVFKKAPTTVVQLKTPAGVTIWRTRDHSQSIKTFLMSIEGMRGHARGKSVPDIILNATEDAVKAYIAGVFDGDGSCGSREASLSSVNPTQLRKIQLLLSGLGIPSTVRKTVLSVTGGAFRNFIRLIPIVSTKRDRADLDDSKAITSRSSMIPRMVFSDIITAHRNCKSPRLNARVAEAAQVTSVLHHKAGIAYQANLMGNIPYAKVPQICELLEGTYLADQLKPLREICEHTQFREIVSITKVGEEKVYDLTVPETESYVANGIVVHNSSASWIWVTKKDERAKEVGRVSIEQAKARNSRSFPFEVGFHWQYMRVIEVDGSTDGGGDSSDMPEPMANLADV